MRDQDAGRAGLAEQFELQRGHLQAIAYRMLGSPAEAEDAVQECWLRLDRVDADAVADLRGWLTTVLGRICLDALRARRSRRESYLGDWLPEPYLSVPPGSGRPGPGPAPAPAPDPAEAAELADLVGLALLVVLERLTPAERLAFVLHDVFAVPFEEIAIILERSPAAARQLASRGRRRVGQAQPLDRDLDRARQRRVVDAFLAAARDGDFDTLLDLLDPEVTVRIDLGGAGTAAAIIGAAAVARQARSNVRRFLTAARPVDLNGTPGLLAGTVQAPRAVLAFTLRDGRIREIYVIAAEAKLARLALR